MTTRVDKAALWIAASPQRLFRAMMDKDKLSVWLPPKGMRARIVRYEPHVGGLCEIEMKYESRADAAPGKTTPDTDLVKCRFTAIEENKRIVQNVEFDSHDPAFAGTMTMTWSLVPSRDGTDVAFICENVPPGIRPEDHAAGLQSTLENLAAFAAAKFR